MTDVATIRQKLAAFDFQALFVDGLGWDRHRARLEVVVEDATYAFDGVAEKRGFQVFLCEIPAGQDFPSSAECNRVQRQVAKSAHENLLIFIDAKRTRQSWKWGKRDQGRLLRSRGADFHKGQSGEALAQRLAHLAVAIEEEEQEGFSLVDVTQRVRAAFDVDRVTRAFYGKFREEHTAFLEFIKGVKAAADREWYASLMLNRLMFVYFIQKKGFLDGDRDYLQNRLRQTQEMKGKDKFHSFYRYFLLRLFHEGFGQRESERAADLESLIGTVPYLNGGLFDVHELEHANPNIQIKDEAFERLFAFFDQYQWHLDDRPLRNDNEINPDVLGYIFEKYINQKQMGAYYTKEDITEYISKNTIIPYLFDAAAKRCAVGLQSGAAAWQLLADDPDRYIYDPVGHGIFVDIHTGERLPASRTLPPEIAAGVSDVSLRDGWNTAAPPEFALPTETWRELIARRQRCEELQQKLAAGEVTTINDLVTLNLNIRQFAQDAIEQCEGPELLRAFYYTIAGRIPQKSNEQFQRGISVLDPTCGSGAFLFAALNILRPLYEACLDKMAEFVETADDIDDEESKAGDSSGKRSQKFADFRRILESIAAHPSRAYFILKSIIISNLFGVDIMPEAVEICKLRLFLQLVSTIEEVGQLEPLPDIDFNIRAGNTLVGFATLEQVRAAVGPKRGKNESSLGLIDEETQEQLDRIGETAEIVARQFQQFRRQQTDLGGAVSYEDKTALRDSLGDLSSELNQYLAREYGVDPGKPRNYEKWLSTHQPLHWFAEFHAIMEDGGFDAIVGNPPYKELREVTSYGLRGYSCVEAGNLYAVVIERCDTLCSSQGRQGYIVPVSSISTDRYRPLQQLLMQRQLHYSSYDDRPSRLFDGLQHIRLTIHLLGSVVRQPSLHSTRYNKWNAEERSALFDVLSYAPAQPVLIAGTLPKLHSAHELGIVSKLQKQDATLAEYYVRDSKHNVYYSRKVGYFVQILDFEPRVLDGQGNLRPPSEFKTLCFKSRELAACALATLNSSMFYWFITVFSDCRHVNKREVDSFPINLHELTLHQVGAELSRLGSALMDDLRNKSDERVMRFRHDVLTVQCIIPRRSKQFIDQIDACLADYLGFTDAERDVIAGYDLKYRIGIDESEGE